MTTNEALWIEYENHLLNLQLTKKRISKLRNMFIAVSRGLNLTTATRKDIEDFLNQLNRNQFLTRENKPYSGSTKSDIKKFLKQYYKHAKGKDEFYPPEVSWIKTRIAKDEKPQPRNVIELKDIPRVAQSFTKYDYKILTLLLFDSGFRIQEMMSVKKMDLTWEDFEEGQKCFWLKCNKSKTFPRKVPVPIFTTELKSFFESSYYRSLQDNQLLFDIHYAAYLQLLKQHSKKVIGKELTCHCLRHSSATYYAKEYHGNVPLLAQRYGWSYSAEELQTYVRESGAYNKEGAKLSFRNEVVRLKEENEAIRAEMDELRKLIIQGAVKEIEAKGR